MQENNHSEIEKIKVQLISQEHRTWAIFSNFFRNIDGEKQKRKASILALIFNFFLSKSTIAIGIVGLLGWYFAWENNQLIKNQNRLIQEQSSLIEAERRSSLMFLYGNLLEIIHEELKENTATRELSEQTIGQIISLSKAFKEYKFLKNDTLISRPLSPERGQLLEFLVNSNISEKSLDEIFKNGNFSFSDLSNTSLRGAYLHGVKLSFSDLSSTDLTYTDFSEAHLHHCNLSFTRVIETDLTKSQLHYSNFNEAYIINANFDKAMVESVEWFDKIKMSADFYRIMSFSIILDRFGIDKYSVIATKTDWTVEGGFRIVRLGDKNRNRDGIVLPKKRNSHQKK